MLRPYLRDRMPAKVYDSYLKVVGTLMLIKDDARLPSGNPVSCHMVCRLVKEMVPEVECHDGYFGGSFQHSWLTLSHYIIDAYPVGLLNPPIIVETGYGLPWRDLYKEADLNIVHTEEFQDDYNSFRRQFPAIKA